MEFGQVLFAGIAWLCALCFAAIALWAFKRKDPMHLWAGAGVNPAEIADVPAFNKANGVMWLVYAGLVALSGVLALVSVAAGAALLVAVCVPGTGVLIAVYYRLFRKYHS